METDGEKCIICFEDNCKYIIVCDKCKFLYCEICAGKINNNCAICDRNQIKNYNEQILSNEFEFEFEFDNDINIENSNSLGLEIFWFYMGWLYYYGLLLLLLPLFIYSIIFYNGTFGRKKY